MAVRRFWQRSPFDVPLLRSLADRARRMQRDRNAPDGSLGDSTDVGVPGRIKVRRFAGPAAHVGKLNLRVVHLTDLHVGRVTPMRVQRAAIDLTNDQKPDLVVITGDFVCHSQEYLDALEEVVRAIKAPTIGVLGNHDHWSGAAQVRKSLERGGVAVLDNAHR